MRIVDAPLFFKESSKILPYIVWSVLLLLLGIVLECQYFGEVE